MWRNSSNIWPDVSTSTRNEFTLLPMTRPCCRKPRPSQCPGVCLCSVLECRCWCLCNTMFIFCFSCLNVTFFSFFFLFLSCHVVLTRYPDYEFISDNSISWSAGLHNRYTENSLRGVILDIHFLSQTDFLVCTFSSQVSPLSSVHSLYKTHNVILCVFT